MDILVLSCISFCWGRKRVEWRNKVQILLGYLEGLCNLRSGSKNMMSTQKVANSKVGLWFAWLSHIVTVFRENRTKFLIFIHREVRNIVCGTNECWRSEMLSGQTDRQTDRHRPSTVTLAAHARRGLIIKEEPPPSWLYSYLSRSIGVGCSVCVEEATGDRNVCRSMSWSCPRSRRWRLSLASCRLWGTSWRQRTELCEDSWAARERRGAWSARALAHSTVSCNTNQLLVFTNISTQSLPVNFLAIIISCYNYISLTFSWTL